MEMEGETGGLDQGILRGHGETCCCVFGFRVSTVCHGPQKFSTAASGQSCPAGTRSSPNGDANTVTFLIHPNKFNKWKAGTGQLEQLLPCRPERGTWG